MNIHHTVTAWHRCLCSLSLLAFVSVYAEEADNIDFDDDRANELENIDVESHRAYPARGSVLSTTIYDSKKMSSLPMMTLESALKINPAIDVRERGGLASQADVSLFGSNWDQTMIMLNGIDFTDARTGHQSNSLPIDIESISKIEAFSDVIGAGAYSGGINYMTKFTDRQFLKAGLTGGDFGLWRTYMNAGVKTDISTAMFSASYLTTDGYRENTDQNNLNLYSYVTLSPERQDHNLGDFEMQAGYQIRSFGSYGFYSLDYPWQWEQTSTFLSSVRWHKSFGRLGVTSFVSYRRNKDTYELFRDGYMSPEWYNGPNHHLTDNIGTGLQLDYNMNFGTTSAGFDYTYNHIFSNVLGDLMEKPKRVKGYPNAFYTHRYDRNVFNYWLRQSYRPFSGVNINASLNLVDSPYGTDLMWGGAIDWLAAAKLRFNLSFARSMRLPTFTDLFYTAPNHVSNPDLRPELAKTLRFATAWSYRHLTLGANAYYRWASNIIDWTREDPDEPWRVKQYSTINTFGVTATATLEYPGRLIRRLQIAYGYTDSSNDSHGHISTYDLNYLRDKLAVTADFDIPRICDLSLIYTYINRNGSFYDMSSELVKYPAYGLLDARITRKWSVFRLHIDINNILNKTYFDFGGLTMPSRWFMAGVSVEL